MTTPTDIEQSYCDSLERFFALLQILLLKKIDDLTLERELLGDWQLYCMKVKVIEIDIKVSQ